MSDLEFWCRPEMRSSTLLTLQRAAGSVARLIERAAGLIASRTAVAVLLPCLVFVMPATAQTARNATEQRRPNVAEILNNVSRVYNVREYELVADGTQTDPKTGVQHPFHVLIAFKGPNRYRLEGTGPGVGFGSALNASGGMLMVEDGSSLWFYSPKEKQYGSFANSVIAQADDDLADAKPQSFDDFAMRRYRTANKSEAKFIREETIQVGGMQIDCYVLSIQGSTWWVDKQRSYVVRGDEGGVSSTFTTIKLGERLPDSLFQFTPPPGAQKIETAKQQ